MGRFEWVILFGVLLGLLVWELVRTRRAIRAARDEEAGRLKPNKPETTG